MAREGGRAARGGVRRTIHHRPERTDTSDDGVRKRDWSSLLEGSAKEKADKGE